MQLLRNTPILALAIALLVVAGGAMVGNGTQAAFTDVATLNSNTFSTGSLDIELANDSEDCDAGGSYSDSVTGSIAETLSIPGSIGTGYVCIRNGGSLTTQWALASSISDDTDNNTRLESEMEMRMWTLTTSASTDGTTCIDGFTAAGADVDLSASQTGYAALAMATSGMESNPSVSAGASTQITTGNQYQKLCFSVVLPNTASDSDPDAASTIQGKTVTANFTITGNTL